MSGSPLWVLAYHRVMDPARATGRDPALISATPDVFERQLRFLASRFRVVSAAQVVDAVRGARPLPDRAVLITFDDGCRDFGEVAWPLLRRYGLPATLFVPTAYPGTRDREFWWDRLFRALAATRRPVLEGTPAGLLPLRTPRDRRAALRALQALVKRTPHAQAMQLVDDVCAALGPVETTAADVLTWAELRALAAEGVSVAAHTQTHPALTQLTPAAARAEIEGSRDDVARELGSVPPCFAYPFGDYDAQVAAAVRDAGFEVAFTCRAGVNDLRREDPRALCRTNIGRGTGPLVLRARLTTLGSHGDRWRERRRTTRTAVPTAPTAPTDWAAPMTARPRVAYVMSRFPKLSETFVLNEVVTLAALGVPVELYPLMRGRQPVAHPEAATWVQRAHFHPFVSWPILRANLHFLRRQPAAYARAWREALGGTWGSRIHFTGAVASLPKAARFAYEMRRDGVTHVHAHFATHPALTALVIHRLTGIPFSFTAHGSDLHVDRQMLGAKVAASAFVVTISEFNKQVMVQECGAQFARKIHVIHCGVDTGFFAPPASAPANAVVQIVCVASLEPVKGHAFLVDACRLLRERGIDFRCDLVGDGPCRREIERQIAGAGLGDHVRLRGGQPRQEVARLLAGADATVLASHPTPDGRREGIPVALMEAMAAGLPVVATAISGIPELVEADATGLLVPSGDPAALADALERLARDPALRQRLGRAARRKVLGEFSLHANTAALLALIDGGVRARRPGGSPAPLVVTGAA